MIFGEELTQNTDLLKLVENKRVAIIGPAPHLVGKNEGELIDSYDVVCRPNRFCVPKKLRKDYGHKTDIMFHNLGAKYMEHLQKEIREYKEEYKELQMICCLAVKCKGRENIPRMKDDYISGVVSHSKTINTNNIPFYWIGVPDYKKIYNTIGCEPNQGVMAISVLSQYPIKELYVSGFTFYDSNTHEGTYYSQYGTGRVGGHRGDSNKNQKNIFRKLIKESNGKIKTDDILSRIIK